MQAWDDGCFFGWVLYRNPEAVSMDVANSIFWNFEMSRIRWQFGQSLAGQVN